MSEGKKIQHLISLKEVSISFGGVAVLNDISLLLTTGKVVLLQGGNGQGKTTLLNIISGHLSPDSGAIIYGQGEKRVEFAFPRKNSLKPVLLRRFKPEFVSSLGIGRVWQDVRLFLSHSVFENIAVGRSLKVIERIFSPFLFAQRHRNFLLARNTLTESLLTSYDLLSIEDANSAKISLGQSKRVAFARLAAAESTLYLLDEPLAGLDQNGIESVVTSIRKLRREANCSILIVEHESNHRFLRNLLDESWLLQDGRLTSTLFISTAYQELPPASDAKFDLYIKNTFLSELGITKQSTQKIKGCSLLEVASESAQNSSETESTVPLLELRNVTVRRNQRIMFATDSTGSAASHGLNLKLYQNKTLTLLAPNGWGKSTLIDVICGVMPIETGQILINGTDVSKCTLNQRIAFGIRVLRSSGAGLINLTVLEIVKLAGYPSVPSVIKPLSNRVFGSLSGGEKQRVMVSTLPKGVICLLDEPFNALDDETIKNLNFKKIVSSYKGVIIFLPDSDQTRK
jgi:ABC-type branched-subunit amino acid transport system ATPase component